MGDQGQHLIGKTYLEQFSFKQGDKIVISVWEKSKDYISSESIKNFLKKINFFDLPTISSIDPRTFEDINGKLETHYPKIIKDIKFNGQLGRNNISILKQFIANLICRTPYMRRQIDALYNDPSTKEKFLAEISMFLDKPKETAIRIVDNIAVEDRLNYLAIFVMLHISIIFKNYDFCILLDFDKRGWITSDNPVVVDYNDNYQWIIPVEAEIYFPLSRDYCLFMYNPNSSKKTNSLRKYSGGMLIEATEEIQEAIYERIRANSDEHIIFPWNLGKVNFLNQQVTNT